MSKAGKRPLSQDAEAQQHDPAADTAHEGDVVDQAEGVRADRRNVRHLFNPSFFFPLHSPRLPPNRALPVP